MTNPMWSYMTAPLSDETPACRGRHLVGSPWLTLSYDRETQVLTTRCPHCSAAWETPLGWLMEEKP